MKHVLLLMAVTILFAAEDTGVIKLSVGHCSFEDGSSEKEISQWMIGLAGVVEQEKSIQKVKPPEWEAGFKIAAESIGQMIENRGIPEKVSMLHWLRYSKRTRIRP